MTKELECLEEIYNWIYCNCGGTTYEDDVKLDKIRKIVEKALQRLEQIENAKPSEALECLENIYTFSEDYNDGIYRFENEYNTIQQALIQAENDKKLLDITQQDNTKLFGQLVDKSKKELALDIIKAKKVYIRDILSCENAHEYNLECAYEEDWLDDEEFDLLKKYVNKGE